MRFGLDIRLTYYTTGGIARYMRHLAQLIPAISPDAEHVQIFRRGHAMTYADGVQRVDSWIPAHHRFETTLLGFELAPHGLDVLHSPDFITPKFGAKHLVSTVHDLTFLLHPEFLTEDSRRYYGGNIGPSVARADAVIAVSNATKADLVNLLDVPAEKVHVIYEGVSERFRPMSPEEIAPVLTQFDLSPGYILFVGTFEPRKNVPGLLRAYAELRSRRSDAPPLVLVGNRGWLFDEAMRLINSLKLTDHVRYFENLPDAELPALYNGAHCLSLTSHYEGFGFPVLEAMNCGVPVVISDRASLPEIAGGVALEVSPDDSSAHADALERLLFDETLRADLRARGLDRARAFTWERCCRETVELYRAVAEGRRYEAPAMALPESEIVRDQAPMP